jgi:hypothetical protein
MNRIELISRSLILLCLAAACVVENPNFQRDTGPNEDADQADDADSVDDADQTDDADLDTDRDTEGDADTAPASYLWTVGNTTCGEELGEIVIPPSTGVTSGQTVIVRVATREGANEAVTVTDDGLNSYTTRGSFFNDQWNSVRVVVLSAFITTPLSPGDVINIQHPPARGFGAVAEVFEGISETDPVASVAANGLESNEPTVEVVPEEAPLLLYGALAHINHTSASAPPLWTALDSLEITCGGAVSNSTLRAGFLRLVEPGSSSLTLTLGQSVPWAAAIVAFRER